MMSAQSGNLTKILRLTFSEPVEWLSEATADDLEVKWICDSIENAHTGDLILLYTHEITSDIMKNAVKQEGVVIMLLGEKTSIPKKIPENLPVCWVEGKYDRREIHRQMMTVLLHQRMAVMEHGFRIYNQLTKITTEGGGLQGLAKAIAEISGKGVMIQDKRGGFLGESPSSTVLSIWGDLLFQLEPLSSLPKQLLDRKEAGVKAGIVSRPIPGGLLRLIHPIIVGDVVLR